MENMKGVTTAGDECFRVCPSELVERVNFAAPFEELDVHEWFVMPGLSKCLYGLKRGMQKEPLRVEDGCPFLER